MHAHAAAAAAALLLLVLAPPTTAQPCPTLPEFFINTPGCQNTRNLPAAPPSLADACTALDTSPVGSLDLTCCPTFCESGSTRFNKINRPPCSLGCPALSSFSLNGCRYNSLTCGANLCTVSLQNLPDICPPGPPSPPVSPIRTPPPPPSPTALQDAIQEYYSAAQAVQPTVTPPQPPITQGADFFQLNVQAAALSLAIPLEAILSGINLLPFGATLSASIVGSAVDRGLTYRDFINSITTGEGLPQGAFNAKLNSLAADLVPVVNTVNRFLRAVQGGRRLLATTAELQSLIPGQSAGFAFYDFTQPRAFYDNFGLVFEGDPLYRRWGIIPGPNNATGISPLLGKLSNLTDAFTPEIFTRKMVKAEPTPGCNSTLRHAVVDLLADRVDFRAAQLGWTLDSALCCLDDARASDAAIWLVYLEAGLLLEPLGIGIQPTGETTAWLCGGSGPGNACSRLATDIRDIWSDIREQLCRD